MRTKTRGLAANLALSAASLLSVLVLIEAGLRLTGLAAPEPTWRRLFDGRWTRLLDCYPSNPRHYFDIDLRLPENAARYRGFAPHRFDAIARVDPWAVEFRYNALRFRDDPLGPKAQGVLRIMVLGDSFTEGQGVKEEDTTARVLGRLLEARSPGRFEVRNCGRRAADFPELFQIFEEVLPYQPDLVVYALVLNDVEQPPEFRALHPYVNDWILDQPTETVDLEPKPPSMWRPRLLDLLVGRVRTWRLDRETIRCYLDAWSDANPGWPRTQQSIREMRRQLGRRGARLAVVSWPLLSGLEGGYPFARVHDTIRRFCLVEGIPYHDLLPVLAGRRSSDLWVHPVDRHPNEVAHRLAAESLLPVLERLAPPATAPRTR